MFIANYLELIERNETILRDSFHKVATRHHLEPDLADICLRMATWSEIHLNNLQPIRARFIDAVDNEPEHVEKGLFHGMRKGGLGLLRDLHDLFILATEVHLTYEILRQAARALHDIDLEAFCSDSLSATTRQLAWIETRIKQASSQVLVAM